MMGEMPVIYCEKGLPRSLRSLAMTDYWIPIPRFHEDRFHGNDR